MPSNLPGANVVLGRFQIPGLFVMAICDDVLKLKTVCKEEEMPKNETIIWT